MNWYQPMSTSRVERKRATRIKDVAVNTATMVEWIHLIPQPPPPGQSVTGIDQVALQVYRYLLQIRKIPQVKGTQFNIMAKMTEFNIRDFDATGHGRVDCKLEVAIVTMSPQLTTVYPFNITIYFRPDWSVGSTW